MKKKQSSITHAVRKSSQQKLNTKMRKKLVGLFGVVVLALVGLAVRITYINASSGDQYTKQVLSQQQQQYESRVLPFKRGQITDRNGTVLAYSEKLYNVILDCKVINSDEDYREPTVNAVTSLLGIEAGEITAKLDDPETEASQYIILKKEVSITDKKAFENYVNMEDEEYQNLSDEEKKEVSKVRNNIKGIWFEEIYTRNYPLNSVASDVIGFTNAGNVADYGIEGYYSDILNGVDGRQYGYFNSDADVEQSIIEPVNGKSLVTTLDVNIQQIVEKHITKFLDSLKGEEETPWDETTQRLGAKNVGVVVQNPQTGEILAMADSRSYDLNNPRDLKNYYTSAQIHAMSEEEQIEALNDIWKNYCVTDAYEPGSTTKPITMAGGLEAGVIYDGEEFLCDGYQDYNGTKIYCDNTSGHGMETLRDAIKHSCNDTLMQIAERMGAEELAKTLEEFNFGFKTGIDLPGESSGITHEVENMGSVELATSSFGQTFTCTMIQEISAISALVNGGYYYKPHVVSKILDENGAVVQNIEPVMEKQVVSEEVSAIMREYMSAVLEQGGTGTKAKVEGYTMGGKTGTAEKYPRSDHRYLVSYIGFAPLDDPQMVIYVVIDEPNMGSQENSKAPAELAGQIMEEILPYMNLYPDEGKEQEEDTSAEAGNGDTSEATAGNGNTSGNTTTETEGNGNTDADDSQEDSETETQDNTLSNPNIPAPLEGGQDGNVLDSKWDSNGLTNDESNLTLQ